MKLTYLCQSNDFQKNIKLIIESAKLLKDRGVKFKLLMVGTGYNEKYIKDYTIELGLQNEVIYTGRVSDKKNTVGHLYKKRSFAFPFASTTHHQ